MKPRLVRHLRRPPVRALMVAATAVAVSGCVDPFPGEPDNYQYRAVIRWTDHGIPHILAKDLGSAAFGQGYAFARLSGCILADQIVKVRSERASFFGPGNDNEHVDSDFVHLHRQVYQRAVDGLPSLSDQVTEVLDGYVAGYNEFIRTRADEMPCGDQPWLRPITSTDLLAHYVELAGLASARQLEDYMLAAVPPAEVHVDPQPPHATPPLSELKHLKIGSNGWGIGRERSFGGGGMVLANPHFPWEGELKLYESHLKVPGKLDVYGASLMGVVGVLIGFNEAMAWTHTVSAGNRFTVYSLKLDPSDPTAYMYDGKSRKMEADSYTIDVLGDDGKTKQVSRTMYRTHWGPVIAPVSQGLPWTRDSAFTFRDANATNLALVEQFLGMDQADSLGSFQAVHQLVQGIPWVNTISASSTGEAWYADTCPTPNLSPEALHDWEVASGQVDGDTPANPIAALFYSAAGVVVLDGSTSKNEWVEEEGAREPGLVPYGKIPQLQRTDYVFNANDSYWSTNPAEPLEGYSPLHGRERTARTPRTRMNAITLSEMGNDAASGPDGKFDFEELRVAALSDRSSTAELLRDELIGRCDGAGTVTVEVTDADGNHKLVDEDVSKACSILADWDRRYDKDSVGAVVWREFIGDFADSSFLGRSSLFAVDFDYKDWIGTPNTLAPRPEPGKPDRILQALAAAVYRLKLAGIALDTPLGKVQLTKRFKTRYDYAKPDAERDVDVIPIHGGERNEGITNIVTYRHFKTTLDPDTPRGDVLNDSTGLTSEGYVVNYGTSFIMTTEFTDEGPHAFAFITYGESDDPESPWYTDQTRRFSDKRWREVLYTEKQIEDDPALDVEVVFGL